MNPNSALRWLPPIAAAGLPVPKTIVVPYKHHNMHPAFDGERCPALTELAAKVDQVIAEFPCPVFIRTDLGSAKHSGPKAYKVDDEPCLQGLYRLLEDQEMKFWTVRPPEAILVREFLTLEAKFEAFCGLPVNREFRFFSDGNKVLCSHPYWPQDALEGHVNEGAYPDWREQLQVLQDMSDPEADTLECMAIDAARACGGGTWSVDFAKDVNGKWWLIDMATAADSYHWPGCVNENAFRREE